MPWSIEYDSGREMALVVARGEILDEDARAQVAEIIRVLRLHHANLVLLDYSEALTEVPLSTLYGLPDYATRLGAPWNVVAAVVLPRSRYGLDSFQFLQLVSTNAGYDFRLFDDQQAAEDWLRQAAPAQAQAK
jgi:hypothetical protein